MMRQALLMLVAAFSIAACTRYDDGIGPDPNELQPPSDLTYELLPSGDPDLPDGVLLRWTDPGDSRIAAFVVYSRGSTRAQWSRRAETTSSSFHDTGVPHLQYYVASIDDVGTESRASNTITIDERNRLPAPNTLVSVSLDGAVQLSWSSNGRTSDPTIFSYYRIYSTEYDLDANLCDDLLWVLEGSTVSEDFIATGLPNGAPRCFAVSTISTDGHESVWSVPRADTPRFDARNVVISAMQSSLGTSGFRFELPGAPTFGTVTSGDRTDIDFRMERHNDGSLWFHPVRAGTRVALYGNSVVTDLTSIDIAPISGYSTGDIEALPGFAYVFETTFSGALQYGAVRVTHTQADYVILDWAYQTDPGNPELTRVRGHGSEAGTL
jgi:hypothetical protein